MSKKLKVFVFSVLVMVGVISVILSARFIGTGLNLAPLWVKNLWTGLILLFGGWWIARIFGEAMDQILWGEE